MTEFKTGFEVGIRKVSTDRREVSGWALVSSIDGKDVTDHQGDVVEMDELRKAAHGFISNARVAKVMHKGEKMGEIVQSVMIDDDFAKAHGIDHGIRGWWITMRVDDDAAWNLAKSGHLAAFSIGGTGTRVPLED